VIGNDTALALVKLCSVQSKIHTLILRGKKFISIDYCVRIFFFFAFSIRASINAYIFPENRIRESGLLEIAEWAISYPSIILRIDVSGEITSSI
jgi:hypothetical protein